MKCPKCAEEFPSGTALCPKCGTFITETESPAQAQQSQRKLIAYAAGAVLLVIIIAALLLRMAFAGRSVTQGAQALPSSGPAVTNAAPPNVMGGPSVTNAPAPTAPPAGPGNTSAKPVPPPQEVLDYLEFVKRVEATRQALLADTTRAVTMTAESQARSLLDAIDMVMDDSSEQKAPKQVTAVANELATQTLHWQQLVQFFDSKPAPNQCAEFAGHYRAALTTEAATIQKILIILNSTNWTDIDSISKANQQLQAMKADPNLQGNIDKAVESADKKLGELCTAYNIPKDFEVKKETSSTGSIIGGF